MDDAEKEARLACVPRPQRFFVYALIGGQHLSNLLVRFAWPFFVPFLVNEFGIGEAQRPCCVGCRSAALVQPFERPPRHRRDGGGGVGRGGGRGVGRGGGT